MMLFGYLSGGQFIVAFLVLHSGCSLPIHAHQPGEVLTKVRRTSDTNSDRVSNTAEIQPHMVSPLPFDRL